MQVFDQGPAGNRANIRNGWGSWLDVRNQLHRLIRQNINYNLKNKNNIHIDNAFFF